MLPKGKSTLWRTDAKFRLLFPGQDAELAVRAGVRTGGGAALPGMVFNKKKLVQYCDAVTHEQREVCAGRMECTMQVQLPPISSEVSYPVRYLGPGPAWADLSELLTKNMSWWFPGFRFGDQADCFGNGGSLCSVGDTETSCY